MEKNLHLIFTDFFKNHFGVPPTEISPLPQGGSDRKYFRLSSQSQSAIAAYNPEIEENRAFIYLTKHFGNLGFPVPDIYEVSDDEQTYLLSDLGDITLFDKLICGVIHGDATSTSVGLLKETLALLAKIQVEGSKGLDFSRCYPKSEFDKQSVMWDFYYFKYSFLKPSGIRFNEAKLDNDFLALANVLLSQPAEYFHYRDFQSRNIMLVNGKPHFIDYQGGRQGPLLYDIASFLYQARANISQQIRDELLDFYLDEVGKYTKINISESKKVFPAFAVFRVIQTLGAYGYRGFFERRAHFLQSIPLAAANLKLLLERLGSINLNLPTLQPVLEAISQKYAQSSEQTQPFDGLTLEINSFSFKKGYPMEHPEHGGGFVFDCRALPNPGRLNQYKLQTGLDEQVIGYLEKYTEVEQFFSHVKELVTKSVYTYKHRGFNHLSVSFGCTGGQHRSVYMASRLTQYFRAVDGIRIVLKHRELKKEL
ncbi:MAG: phosphotransferase [Bacteroidales bacterium]